MNTNSVPQAVFGPGSLYLTRTDIAGSTPVNIGFCQEFSYDESASNKELYGQNQYPLVVARGTVKATGKIKAATISGLALSAAIWGLTPTTGSQLAMTTTAATAIPAGDSITPVVPGSGTFDTDLGVINAATGIPMTKVASAPAAGQYSVASGVYTFAAADQTSGVSVKITFAYTSTGSSGMVITVTNQLIGVTPTFQLDYASTLYGAGYYVRFFSCVSSELTRAHKLEDFMQPEIDFGFFANAAGNVYEMSLANAA